MGAHLVQIVMNFLLIPQWLYAYLVHHAHLSLMETLDLNGLTTLTVWFIPGIAQHKQ